MGKSLLDKVWDLHTVRRLPSGEDQLYIGLHLVHEVTSPQAFAMLAERGLAVLRPERTFATADHIIPTDSGSRPFADRLAEEMMKALEANAGAHGIRFFGPGVLGPEGEDVGVVVSPHQPNLIRRGAQRRPHPVYFVSGDRHPHPRGAHQDAPVGTPGGYVPRHRSGIVRVVRSRAGVRAVVHDLVAVPDQFFSEVFF